MSVITLQSMPDRPEEWANWAFANAAHHRDIIRVVLARKGIILNEYQIDPIDFANFDQWLTLHQTMHQAQNAAVGISGYDLTTVDPEDPEDMANWIAAHADEHIRIDQLLNLG